MKICRSEAIRRIYETDRYLIIFEYYTRPPRAINSFATTLIEILKKKRIHQYRKSRMGACIAIDKQSGAIDAVCVVYVKGTYVAVCTGRDDAIETIRRRLCLVSIHRIPTT